MMGPADPVDPAQNTARWENEGGAQSPFGKALPEGITTRVIREYLVGPYRYSDLPQAIAERDRQKLSR